ncbi:MAG: hypothetical protein U1A23_01215, partial [Candidatus Sungbacteria bacterium]|nr:hypothetical protein [Candidatus Sungbacteria bacterium]
RKYLIDIDGYIIYDHIGEGGYEETEQAIEKALAERNARLNIDLPISSSASKPIDSMDADSNKVGSPEIYFGSDRNERLSNGSRGVSGTQTFVIPKSIVLNNLYLGGSWNITPEFIESTDDSSIVFRYKAKNVYFVAGSGNGTQIEVYKDDKLLKSISVKEEKLYKVIEDTESSEHTLIIKIKGSGLKAFTFTFG